MSKAKKLIVGILCGFSADHEIVKEALADRSVIAEIVAGVKFTKEDLFSMKIGDRFLLEHPEAWRHIDALVDLVRKGGGSVSGPDFLVPIKDDECAGDFALEHKALDKIFTVAMWTGRVNEMEQAWIRLCKLTVNTEKDRIDLKRAIAKAEGRSIREDRLAAMEITSKEIRDAIKCGNYDIINEKFKRYGDYLRKEDIFLIDSMGDHMLDNKEAWDKAGKLWEQLATHGEFLTVREITAKYGDNESVLEKAFSRAESANNLFHPVLWRDRVEEMMELLSYVPEDKWEKINLESIMGWIAEEELKQRTASGVAMRKDDLTADLNDAFRGKLLSHYFSIRALGMESSWQSIDKITKTLAADGEAITIDDLRLPSGPRSDTCLLLAARYGYFDKVMDILRASGQKLTYDDLSAKGSDGKNVLLVLAQKSQLNLIFTPELWAGRAEEMVRLWKQLSTVDRGNIDFESILSATNRLTLRNRFVNKGAAPAP